MFHTIKFMLLIQALDAHGMDCGGQHSALGWENPCINASGGTSILDRREGRTCGGGAGKTATEKASQEALSNHYSITHRHE